MITIKLAKACRRREKGAPMMVSERAAYKMMKDGLAVKDKAIIEKFEGKPEKAKTEKKGKPKK
jgi:hypothetical protein